MHTGEVTRIEASGISVQRLLAIIETQNEIARSSIGFDQVLTVVAQRAMALTDATGSVVELVDGDAMAYRTTCGTAATYSGLRLPRTNSLSGMCVELGVALASPDTACDDRVDHEACRRVGAASMICVPLMYGDHAVGVLEVLSTQSHAFNAAAQATLVLLADLIATSMHHAREYDDAVTMSLHDPLTGLLNRRAFEQQLSSALADSASLAQPVSIALFDLDGLTAANDTLGHTAGDEILRRTAQLLRAALRSDDRCFRLGGDEFAVLLPDTSEDNARRAARRCCATVQIARLGRGTVGVSAGVAELRSTESQHDFIARADAEMDRHKQHNRALRLAAGSAPLPREPPER